MATKKVVLSAKKGAAPGFPGFFGWLAATHPQLYSRVQVALPSYATNYGKNGGSASQLAGPSLVHGPSLVPRGMGGLGADEGLTTFAAPDLTALSNPQAFNFGATDSTPLPTANFSDTIANTIKTLASSILPAIGQQKLLDVQLQRAKAGLPPLDTTGYTDNAGINVGLNTGTQKTFLMIAGIGAAALIGHSLLKGKRR